MMSVGFHPSTRPTRSGVSRKISCDREINICTSELLEISGGWEQLKANLFIGVTRSFMAGIAPASTIATDIPAVGGTED
jgi:hypothetical protein